MIPKFFGTDGIRGEFGREPITPQTVLKLGWAIGTVLRQQDLSGEVLIGKDTRISGYLLESALTCGLSSAGVSVSLLGPLPTPVVSYLTKSTDAIAGIVISASHNPYYDNGIKLFSRNGSKLPAKMESDIETMMATQLEVVAAKNLGKVNRFPEPAALYNDYCDTLSHSRLDNRHIVLDCANGACYRVAPEILRKRGANLTVISDSPDGFNINRNCGSTNPEAVRAKTVACKADIGIALDGDGDRVILVDEKGNLVNGDQILFILAMAKKRAGKLRGGVVGTHLTNIGLEKTLEKENIPFVRVKVGDRYISEYLEQRNWNLGGEESGHILNAAEGVSGDGLISALEVLEEMKMSGKPLSSLTDGVELVPQVTRNVRLARHTAPLTSFDLKQFPKTNVAKCHAEKQLGNGGRILLRPSGTEPVVRILVEGDDTDEINAIADQVAKVVHDEVGCVTAES